MELIDDLDGKPAAETLAFGLDGVTYEIDLSEKNSKALRKALDLYVASARRVGGRKTRTDRKGLNPPSQRTFHFAATG